MGYININTEGYLTQKGKEELLKGNGLKVKYFLLGDSDINYNIKANENTFISDISGDNDCTKSLSKQFLPKSFIWVDEIPLPFVRIMIDNETIFPDNIYTKSGSNSEKIELVLDFSVFENSQVIINFSEISDDYLRKIEYNNNTYFPINKNITIPVLIKKESLKSNPLILDFKNIPLSYADEELKKIELNINLSGETSNIQIPENNPNEPLLKLIKTGELVSDINFSLSSSNATQNQSDGFITISNITGGIMPYKYDLYKGSNLLRNNIPIITPQLTNVLNLSSGFYNVFIKDINNISVSGTTEVLNTSVGITFDYQIIRNSFDFYPNSGAINIDNIQGGNGTYLVDLNRVGGGFNQTYPITNLPINIYNLPAGTYNLTARDTLGITNTKQFNILSITLPNIIITYNNSTREIKISNVVKINDDSNGKHLLKITKTSNGNSITIDLPYFDGIYTYIIPNQRFFSNSTYDLLFSEYLTNRTASSTIIIS